MRAALAIVIVAACGHHDSAPTPAPAPVAHIDAAPAIAASPPDAAPPDPFDGLFAKGPVRPPPPLDALPLDATLADAKRAAPALFAEHGVTLPRWPELELRADVVLDEHDRPFEYLGSSIVFRGITVPRATLERSWGTGQDAADEFGRAAVVWFDPAAGVRATLYDTRIEFRRYLPLATLLGAGPDVAVGPTPDALVAAHPNHSHKYGPEAALPPTEWDLDEEGFMTVQSTVRLGDHVSMYALYIPYKSRPAARDEIEAAFEHKWGKGTPKDGAILFVDGPIEVVARDSKGGGWYLEVKDRALYAKGQAP